MNVLATIEGTVMKGVLMGRKMGFPTINVAFDTTSLPFGVYASRVRTPDGVYKGALHYGPRKVLSLMEPSLEVHLLDFSGDLYGQKVTIEVLEKIRDTKDFEDMDALKRQIRFDVDAVRATDIPLQ
ncbi:MAG: riboflavin kinase [Candidatus Gracilibacteria bacterium]